MATLKCKMCGGDLEISEGATVCECEYCGSKQTVPTVDNEKKITLFGRANRLRFGCEFDKAAGVYETIVAEFPEEAEAYWGLVLCKFGIEYVDDPTTGKKVPTCHRSSFGSVMDDTDFEQAVENADSVAKKVYREEAKAIEEIRRGIIEVSGKEEPYDVFICYKETDENGGRTIDSVIAQDVYDALTEKGYRVFFSRITLEDKLGQEYEPYIFAALNSAKLMLAFGTDYEYYNAVWVKNEWSRYLKLMAQDKNKHLIPCFKGIDAYDMPKEFAKLQSQDMGKVGAIQDLLRGIDKLIGKKTSVTEQVIIRESGSKTKALVERGNMALEDGEWQKADDFFEEVLNQDAECAEAYLGKLLAELKISAVDELIKREEFVESGNYKKILRFGDAALIGQLENYIQIIKEEQRRIEEEQRQKEEEHKRKIDMQIQQIAVAIGDMRIKKEVEHLQRDIDKYRDEINEIDIEINSLAIFMSELPGLQKKLDDSSKLYHEKLKKIEELTKEKDMLGLFSGKRKKEIDLLQTDLYREKDMLESELKQIKEDMRGYTSESIQSKIVNLKKDKENLINEKKGLENSLHEKQSCSGSEMNYEEVIRNLEDFEVRKRFIEEYPELAKYHMKNEFAVANVSDTVTFGNYNGSTQWRVLAKEYNKMLIISLNAIGMKPYNEKLEGITWEKCTLRDWLNSEYLETTFDTTEQALILSSYVINSDNPEYGTDGGRDTTDKVFLLSIDEENKYFSSDNDRKTTLSDGTSVWWWLRSPASNSRDAAVVSPAGSVGVYGTRVDYDERAVRPALWVDISNP